MEFRRVLFRSHACHLRLAVGQGQQTAGDVDIAARQGEGVDDVAVQDREGEGYPRLARLVGQAPPDAVVIGCQPGVVVDPAEGLDDLRILLCPDLRFLGLGDEEELPAPGRRVGGAARQPERQGGEQKADDRAGPEEAWTTVHSVSKSAICAGWVASISGPLYSPIQPRTRMRWPSQPAGSRSASEKARRSAGAMVTVKSSCQSWPKLR